MWPPTRETNCCWSLYASISSLKKLARVLELVNMVMVLELSGVSMGEARTKWGGSCAQIRDCAQMVMRL